MSTRYYLETLPSGKQQWVKLKRSRSHGLEHHHHHGHHHHHHDHGHHCAHVTKEQWKELVERERATQAHNEALQAQKDALARENSEIKANLSNVEGELRRAQSYITDQTHRINHLVHDNHALQHSLNNAAEQNAQQAREIEQLRHKHNKLEKENDTLHKIIRDLKKQLQDRVTDEIIALRRDISHWIRKYEALDSHNHRLRQDIESLRGTIAELRDRIGYYQRILRRHGLC
jgi:chromosome segregation ATPase